MPTSSETSQRYKALSAKAAAITVELGVLEGTVTALQDILTQEQERERQSAALAEELGQAGTILQSLEAGWRQHFESVVANLISGGLSAVFGEPVSLTIESRVVRDVLSTELKLTMGDGARAIVISDILGGAGGSVVNVLSLLLRVFLVTSMRPPMRRLLVLDEPFAFIDEYEMPQTVGRLLKELSERLDLQFLIVSHEPALAESADVAYEVRRQGTTATVRRTQ